MNKQQLFTHITSTPKWYKQAGITINAASMLKKRFPLGLVSHERFVQLAEKFGYKELPGDWVKEGESEIENVCRQYGYSPALQSSCTHSFYIALTCDPPIYVCSKCGYKKRQRK